MVVRLSCLLLVALTAAFVGADPVTIAAGTTNDTESRIASLSDGRLMAAIGRNPYGRWDTTDIYASFSADDGASWSAPALAVGAPGDQATIGLLQLPGDTIRLWYGSNESGTYRIHTAYLMNGSVWTAEGQVALGWGSTVQCYDPTVILGPDSSLTMIYRGGSGTSAGAYVAHRPKGGSWDTSRRMVNARAFRPRIMRHADGTYLAAFQRQSGSNTANIDIFVRHSSDLTAWSDSVRLTTNQNSHDAWCLFIPDSGYVVYYAKYQNAPFDAYNLCRRRSADGIAWQAEQQLTVDGSLLHNTQPSLFALGNGLYRSWTRANDYDNDNDILFERFPLGASGESAPDAASPKASRLQLGHSPNPASGRVLFSFSLDRRTRVTLSIYNIAGQKLAVPLSTALGPGAHQLAWDCRDDKGRPLAGGVYWYRMATGHATASGRLVLCR